MKCSVKNVFCVILVVAAVITLQPWSFGKAPVASRLTDSEMNRLLGGTPGWKCGAVTCQTNDQTCQNLTTTCQVVNPTTCQKVVREDYQACNVEDAKFDCCERSDPSSTKCGVIYEKTVPYGWTCNSTQGDCAATQTRCGDVKRQCRDFNFAVDCSTISWDG